MKSKIFNLVIITIISLIKLEGTAMCATPNTPYFDSYYQYRFPITIKSNKDGWHQIPCDEKRITDLINQLEEMKYDSDFFSYNYLKVVEIDDEGKVIDPAPEAGFYMVPASKNLLSNISFGQGAAASPIFEFDGLIPAVAENNEIKCKVKPDSYYQLKYISEGGGSSPAVNYEPLYPAGTVLRGRKCHGFKISYEPRLLRKEKTTYETLIQPDSEEIKLRFKGRFVGKLSKISLREVKIKFLANLKTPGTKRFMVYYQPMCSYHLMVPMKKYKLLPKNSAKLESCGKAEKFIDKTMYTLSENPKWNIWFASSTVKLTPNIAHPITTKKEVLVSGAGNETLSFQLVISPKANFSLKNVTASGLKKGKDEIVAENITFKLLEYVPIHRYSITTPAKYRGLLGDPLLPVKSTFRNKSEGNLILWVSVAIPNKAKTGIYKGKLQIVTDESDETDIPLTLQVYDFSLPEYSPYKASMGGRSFAKQLGARKEDPKRPFKLNMQYHGVKTKEGLKRLANAYFKIMAKNKFFPASVCAYIDTNVKWNPPPYGYNVDKSDNFFKLHSWDFSEYNKQLGHYVKKYKLNSIMIYHTNPTACNIFQLPGEENSSLNFYAPHFSRGWQIYRKLSYFAYGRKKGDMLYDKSIEISKKQYDRLVLDYFKAIAENLEKHGWLDYAWIAMDETHDEKKFLNFLRILKSDPLTARIKVGSCMQAFTYLNYKENESDGHYAYNGLIDFYSPQIDEFYNRWEDYYFDDYQIMRSRKKLFPYIVRTSRIAIDTPGINNRIFGLDMFRRNARGHWIFETFIYENMFGNNGGTSLNPWVDPYATGANGALSFFYPPRKGDIPDKPDFTITPSARVMTHREGVNDYEYAHLLEKLIAKAEKEKINVTTAKNVLKDIKKLFYNSVHWTQNDEWFLSLKERIAETIIDLKTKLEKK